MKRALVVLALCSAAFFGFAQAPISGTWEFDACLSEGISSTLTSTLTICGSLGWAEVCSVSEFDSDGWASQEFTLEGTIGGLFTLEASMAFDPSVPSYMYSTLATSLTLAGLEFGIEVVHWLDDYQTEADTVGLCTGDYGAGMLYTLTAEMEPLSLEVSFVDCCTGIMFNELIVGFDIGLCCGITLDGELAFNKAEGFEYLEVTGIKIPLCCGVYIDAGVKFTVDSKSLSVDFGWEGFPAEACFEVYGDVLSQTYAWTGIDIYGWKIACKLGDCSSVEFVTFLQSAKAPKKFGFYSACGEFEYIGLSFCGAACCGGQYKAGIKIYFGSAGGLFDVTRIVGNFSIPIFTGFTFDVSAVVPAAECAAEGDLCIGWTFKF